MTPYQSTRSPVHPTAWLFASHHLPRSACLLLHRTQSFLSSQTAKSVQSEMRDTPSTAIDTKFRELQFG